MVATAVAILAVLACVYMYLLERLLSSSHPQATLHIPQRTEQDLLQAGNYDDLAELLDLPPASLDANIIITGASGSLGSALVDILLLRGHKSLRLLDIIPPDQQVLDNPACEYIRTDISLADQVRIAFQKPFKNTSKDIVVHHTASIIRFWERLAYQWHISYNINVQGTNNIIEALQSMPYTHKRLIYTSTNSVILPQPRFFRLKKAQNCLYDEYSKVDKPNMNHYHRSKRLAEQLVLAANGQNGLSTIALRPGMAIHGPQDLTLPVYLVNKPNVAFFSKVVMVGICVRDAARAHIFADVALADRPADVGGRPFVVTGDNEAWTLDQSRTAVQTFAGRDLAFQRLRPVVLLIVAHIIEVVLWVRYALLTAVYGTANVKPTPTWSSKIQFLQPAMLDTPFLDVMLDDSRARKELGYRHVYSSAQTIKWTVDEVERKRRAGLSLGKVADLDKTVGELEQHVGR